MCYKKLIKNYREFNFDTRIIILFQCIQFFHLFVSYEHIFITCDVNYACSLSIKKEFIILTVLYSIKYSHANAVIFYLYPSIPYYLVRLRHIFAINFKVLFVYVIDYMVQTKKYFQ